jgi:hypothetical protein
MSQIAVLRNMLLPRIRSKRWADEVDDPMSKREGKYFNMGVDAAADELDRAFKELEGLVAKGGSI